MIAGERRQQSSEIGGSLSKLAFARPRLRWRPGPLCFWFGGYLPAIAILLWGAPLWTWLTG